MAGPSSPETAQAAKGEGGRQRSCCLLRLEERRTAGRGQAHGRTSKSEASRSGWGGGKPARAVRAPSIRKAAWRCASPLAAGRNWPASARETSAPPSSSRVTTAAASSTARLQRLALERPLVQDHADPLAPFLLAVDPDQPARSERWTSNGCSASPRRPGDRAGNAPRDRARSGRRGAPLAGQGTRARRRRRYLPWEDHQLGGGVDRPGLLEEAERRARRHFNLLEAVHAPVLGKEPVGHLGGLARGEQDEEPASGDIATRLADLQRERGQAPFPLRASRPISAGCPAVATAGSRLSTRTL